MALYCKVPPKPAKTRFGRFLQCLRSIEAKMAAKVVIFAHLGYYALVAVEAHGNYRYAAAAVLALMILEKLGETDV